MTLTREFVATLNPGDVVTMTSTRWPEDSAVTGKLIINNAGSLFLPLPDDRGYVVRYENGSPFMAIDRTVTVVKRAPVPFYTNSDREKPVPGDVAVNEKGEVRTAQPTMVATGGMGWWGWHTELGGHLWTDLRCFRPDGTQLTLIADGTTGKIVKES